MLILLAPALSRATPLTGEIFYTRYSGSSRVEKVTVSYDGASTFTLGTPVSLSGGHGADGIAGNPNDPGSLLVGGQGGVVYRVSKSGAGVLQSVGTTYASYHLEVADSSTLYSSGIPGELNRIALNPDGSMGSSDGISVIGVDPTVTQIISTPSGDYYTNSGSGGFGSFGTIAIGGVTATTTRMLAGIPAAHGGVYDPYTDTIILFGDGHITQISLGGAVIADLVVSGMSMDQGTVDGSGHIFGASNTGHLVFIDYAGAAGGLISGYSFIATPFLATTLDDIAPLVGAGSTSSNVPEPASLLLLGLGLAGIGLTRRGQNRA